MADDTGWKPIQGAHVTRTTESGAVTGAGGTVEAIRGTETSPCCMCKSWEKDEIRLRRHLLANGCTVRADGKFVTRRPLDRDGKPVGEPLAINVKEFGFCRLQGIPTQDLASCPDFSPVKYIKQLKTRL